MRLGSLITMFLGMFIAIPSCNLCNSLCILAFYIICDIKAYLWTAMNTLTYEHKNVVFFLLNFNLCACFILYFNMDFVLYPVYLSFILQLHL